MDLPSIRQNSGIFREAEKGRTFKKKIRNRGIRKKETHMEKANWARISLWGPQTSAGKKWGS